MIGTLLEFITGPLGALAGAVLAFLGVFIAGRRGGRNAERDRREKDAAKRLEQGRDRLRDGRGGDPAERLRRNDGEW